MGGWDRKLNEDEPHMPTHRFIDPVINAVRRAKSKTSRADLGYEIPRRREIVVATERDLDRVIKIATVREDVENVHGAGAAG